MVNGENRTDRKGVLAAVARVVGVAVGPVIILGGLVSLRDNPVGGIVLLLLGVLIIWAGLMISKKLSPR